MKHTRWLVCIVSASLVLAQAAVAGNSDVEIHCFARKIDEKVNKASDGDANTTKEHWNYDVTVENKTFKPLANLEVKYAIFFKQERLGEKADATPRNQSGSFSIPTLASHEKKTFTTDAVELHKANLVGNWIYTSGAKPNAQGTLVGLALRVYQSGQQFADYANPSNLGHEKW